MKKFEDMYNEDMRISEDLIPDSHEFGDKYGCDDDCYGKYSGHECDDIDICEALDRGYCSNVNLAVTIVVIISAIILVALIIGSIALGIYGIFNYLR